MICVCVVCGGDREGGVVGREEEGLQCICVFVCDLCLAACSRRLVWWYVIWLLPVFCVRIW